MLVPFYAFINELTDVVKLDIFQESFFGHFKDEVNYKNCTHLYELIDLADRYMSYYNTERGQWTRNRMTPVRYQVYLQSMSDEEFSVYLEKETAKYEKIKAMQEEYDRDRRNLDIIWSIIWIIS